MYNVMLASGAQQSDSVIHISNSLHLLIPNSQSIPPPPLLPLGTHKSVLYVCESLNMQLLFISKIVTLPSAIIVTFQPEGRTAMGEGVWVERRKGGHKLALGE